VERADIHYRPIVTVTPVTHKSQTLAPASLSGLSLLAVVVNATTEQKYPVLLEYAKASFERMEQ
jgi:hypothetical protein